MSLKNIISEQAILPLSDLITGNSIAKNLKFLMKSQYWSRQQIDDYQNQKLQQIIQHAYSYVPYYRELFEKNKLKPEDIKTKDDLYKIPITAKSDLKNNNGKHLAPNISVRELLFRSSSGSTGEPFQFYTTKNAESFLKAAAIRGWYWMGYRLGDKYVKLSMNPRTSIQKKIQDKINNSLYLTSTQLSSSVFEKIKTQIHKFDPTIIRCYPVPLLFLANQIVADDNECLNKSLKAINTTGSTLSDENRKFIENVFNVRIYDSYSCEGGTIYFQCSNSQFYHPAEEYGISEFIEDDFSKANDDSPLRHITTDLHNYASPFIRYDTQDYIIVEDKENCGCGRNYINIKKIMGRDSDILITPSGKYLIVENFVAYFEWINEVDQIQVVQDKKNEIVINMVVNDTFSQAKLKEIFSYWKSYIGDDVMLSLTVVDEIQLTPTGKRRTVIRNPEIKLYD